MIFVRSDTMNFFKKLNRKQRREFDKLEKDKKIEIISHEINEKIKGERNKIVAKAFADGFIFANKMFFDKYFKDWDKLSEEGKSNIAELIALDVKKSVERYNKQQDKENEQSESEGK